MRHSEYISYFKTISDAHVDINYFMRMVPVEWPMRNVKLEQFLSSLRSSEMAFPFMLLETFNAKLKDWESDNIDKNFDGAYLIIDTAKPGDFTDEDTKYDTCEQIAEECLAYIFKEFEDNYNAAARDGKRFIDKSSVSIEKIGMMADNFVGVRVNFTFKRNVAHLLKYDDSKFNFV